MTSSFKATGSCGDATAMNLTAKPPNSRPCFNVSLTVYLQFSLKPIEGLTRRRVLGCGFKPNENIEKISSVYSDAQDTPDIRVTVNIFPGKPITNPHLPLTFVCINEDGIIFKAYYDHL